MKPSCVLSLLALLAPVVQCSHFAYGTHSWTRKSTGVDANGATTYGNDIDITIQYAWRWSFYYSPPVNSVETVGTLIIQEGGQVGTEVDSHSLDLTILKAYPKPSDWMIGEYKLTWRVPKPTQVGGEVLSLCSSLCSSFFFSSPFIILTCLK